jgi:multiple sugar transport system substrate-binding protein
MRMRIIACTAAALIMLLSGFRQNAAAAVQTVEFATWQWEEPGFSDWWKSMTAAFEEAHPDIRINVTQLPFNDYIDQLTIRFASGRPPAVFELPSENLGLFASQDWLLPLDDRISGTAIASDKWSPLQREMVWKGKTMGVLLMAGGPMMFYNKSYLDAAGVAVPTSYASFGAALAKITDRSKGVFGLSAVTTEHPTIANDLIQAILWNGGEPIKDGHYNLTDPKVVAAVEAYRRVTALNAPLGNNSTIKRQLFADGKAAFMLDGPWLWPLVQRAKPELRSQFRMVPVPFKPTLGGAVDSMHIAAGVDAATQEAAWSFVAFMIEPEWERKWTLLTTSPAPRIDALTSDDLKARPELETTREALVGVQPTMPLNEAIRGNYNEFSHILQSAAVQVLSTTTPVAQIMQQTQAALEQAVPLH